MTDREVLFKRHPFLRPGGAPWLVVCGDDLDALLSAALYLKHHPAARIGGYYAAFRRLHLSKEALAEPGRCAWLDLDIAHPACASLGHHVLKRRRDDEVLGHPHTLNLNTLRGVSLSNFAAKYPLGTVHFLAWLYEEAIPEASGMERLLWLADSAFINGQSHRFRRNVGAWLEEELPHPPLLRGFGRLDEPGFEDGMAALMGSFERQGFKPGRVQTRSFHRALGGYSVRLKAEDVEGFRRLSGLIASLTGWPRFHERIVKGEPGQWRGVRRREALTTVLGGRSLAQFCREERVFSYALPGMGELNYTVFDAPIPFG